MRSWPFCVKGQRTPAETSEVLKRPLMIPFWQSFTLMHCSRKLPVLNLINLSPKVFGLVVGEVALTLLLPWTGHLLN